MFTILCAREMDKYVPFRSGILKNTRFIGVDTVFYPGPYAHYQYIGRLMVDAETGSAWGRKDYRKVYAEPPVELEHDGAPLRGPYWDKRMWADRKNAIMDSIANAAGGVAK